MLEVFANRVVARGAIDPAFIVAIIASVMQILQQCPKPTKDAVRSGRVGIFQRARLAATLANHGVPNAVRVSATMIEEALEQQNARGAGVDGKDWCDAIEAEVNNA